MREDDQQVQEEEDDLVEIVLSSDLRQKMRRDEIHQRRPGRQEIRPDEHGVLGLMIEEEERALVVLDPVACP